MKDTIEKLKKERETLMDRVKKIDNAIKAFQEVCTHKREDGSSAVFQEGHDSHKDYYYCTICGYEYSV